MEYAVIQLHNNGTATLCIYSDLAVVCAGPTDWVKLYAVRHGYVIVAEQHV